MNYFLEFNNIRNYDLGISIVKRPNIPSPTKNRNKQEVPGHDGDYYIDLGGYSDIVIPVEFNFIEKGKNIKQTYRRVKDWINYIDNERLIFSDDPEFFYKVVDTKIDEFETVLKRKGMFRIEFTCRAYLYLIDGADFTEERNLYNQFKEPAKPLIYIEGNGIVNVTINNNAFSIPVGDYVYIDSELELAYREKDDFFNIKTGDLPKLYPGENIINYTGNVTKFEIKPRWRCL